MTAPAALVAHGFAELAADVAREHGVADVAGAPAAVDELVLRLAAIGWSRPNVERLLGRFVERLPAPRMLRVVAPPPRTEPVHLVVLAVDALTTAEQHFRCAPYGATLTAGACVARQRAEQYPKRVRWQHHGAARTPFPRCAECTLGRRVEAAVAEPAS